MDAEPSSSPDPKTVEHYRNAISGDEEIEATFRELRRDGHSRVEALEVILELLDLSLQEAKTVLHTNKTWAEARAQSTSSNESPSDEPPSPSATSSPNDVPPAPA